MAIGMPLLSSSTPTAVASADVHIGHVQLRDLIVCPRERGIVNYVKQNALMEQNLAHPNTAPRKLVDLPFTPNTLTSMAIPGTDDTLLAAGGQEAEIHLSCYSPSSSRHRRAQLRWHFDDHIHGSINNSLLLTSLSMSSSHQSSIEPRVAVSNNDGTVRFFDIPVRNEHFSSLPESGCVQLNTPINHSSISPDGRTLLSVGDSSKVFLHRLNGGSRINITPIATLSLPPPDVSVSPYASTALVASFSTCFSSDGIKYAVASQEGVVAVWDVRSTKPLKTFQTDKSRVPLGNGGATGWLTDDPWEWTRGSCKAPGWSVRNVKFSQGGRNGMGKEIMTFTEHTSLLHVIDARTFETEEVVHVPHASQPPPQPPAPQSRSHPTLPPREDPPTPSSYMFMALEDTFRISSREEDDADLVVIPPMGDRDVENDVQVLLAGHGLRARQRFYSANAEDVDELDCLSSRAPSRSSSPSPSVHLGSQYTFSPPPLQRTQSSADEGLDIAGVCFDPTGGWLYAATTESVAEWGISGAEKRWWFDDGWA